MRSVRAQRSVGLLLAGLLVLAVAPTVAARTTPFHLDIGRRADYVAQKNLVQCVGASMQMMLNIMSARNDRTAATQLRLQKLARQWSGPSRNGRIRAGASVRGWAKGLTMVGGGPIFFKIFLDEQRKQPDTPILPKLRFMTGGGALPFKSEAIAGFGAVSRKL